MLFLNFWGFLNYWKLQVESDLFLGLYWQDRHVLAGISSYIFGSCYSVFWFVLKYFVISTSNHLYSLYQYYVGWLDELLCFTHVTYKTFVMEGWGHAGTEPPKLWCLQKNLFKTLITTKIMLSKLYFAPLPTLKSSYGPEVCLAL